MKKPSAAVVHAWIGLMRAQQLAFRSIERAFRDAGLAPYGWYDALWELDRAGDAGLTASQIERQVLLAQSNVSRLIDRLEDAGCVVRRQREDDRRSHTIVITAKGRRLRKSMWPVYAEAIQAALGENVSEAEAARLASVLKRIADALGG